MSLQRIREAMATAASWDRATVDPLLALKPTRADPQSWLALLALVTDGRQERPDGQQAETPLEAARRFRAYADAYAERYGVTPDLSPRTARTRP